MAQIYDFLEYYRKSHPSLTEVQIAASKFYRLPVRLLSNLQLLQTRLLIESKEAQNGTSN